MSKKNKIVIIVAVLVVIAFAFILFKPKKGSSVEYNSLLKNLLSNQDTAPKLSDFLPKEAEKKSRFFNKRKNVEDVDYEDISASQNAEDLLPNKPIIQNLGFQYSINQL